MKEIAMRIVIGIFLSVLYMNPLTVFAEELPILNKNELYIAFLNLPDGESTLIKTENGKNFLINTGSGKSEEELLSQLEELGIKQIDTLLLTKQTIDYCGNAKRIITRYNINKTIHAGQLSNICKEQVTSTKLVKWKTNMQISLTDHLQVTVLEAEANGEMSLDVRYGKTSTLYLSNSDVEDEEKLLRYTLDPEILKIGDYGRGKSPSALLLDKIDPHLSIIFNFAGDKPNDGLIERLNESWIDVYRLKQVGTTVLKLNLQDYEVLS